MVSVALQPGSYDVAVRVMAMLGGGAIGWKGVVPLTSAVTTNQSGTPVPTIVLQPHGQPAAAVPATPAHGTTRQTATLAWLGVAATVVVLLLLGTFGLRLTGRREPRIALELQFTQHARDQMTLRGVSQAEVMQVLADRGVTYPDQYGNPCYVRMIGRRRIRVVVAGGSNPARIITVTSQAQETARAADTGWDLGAEAGNMTLKHDAEAGAAYITLRDVPCAGGQDLDDGRRVDFGPDRQPRGIELLNVDHGVRTTGLPGADQVADLLRAGAIAVIASAATT